MTVICLVTVLLLFTVLSPFSECLVTVLLMFFSILLLLSPLLCLLLFSPPSLHVFRFLNVALPCGCFDVAYPLILVIKINTNV